MQLEVKAVLLIERFAQPLGSLGSQGGRRIELNDALLFRASDEFVNGRAPRHLKLTRQQKQRC